MAQRYVWCWPAKAYPEKVENGKQIRFSNLPENMICFHAGTKLENDGVITSGGRVLDNSWSNDIASAIDTVYSNMNSISFEGMNYRRDIGHRALKGAK